MISFKQLIPALYSLGISTEHIEAAKAELLILLDDLDKIEVKGRKNLDTLLGCMMAIDAIIGLEAENG